MTTAIDFISRALRTIDVYGSEETVTAADAQIGLVCLNDMLDSWSADSLYIYQFVRLSTTAVINTATYTVGPAGNFDTGSAARPTNIGNIVYTVNGVDYFIKQINRNQYAEILVKNDGGIPAVFYYEPAFPLSTITFWPVPDTAGTITIQVPQLLTQFTALDTDIDFPPGYKSAIHLGLCVALCNEFACPLPQQIALAEAQARRRIMRINTVVPVLGLPREVIGYYQYLGGYRL